MAKYGIFCLMNKKLSKTGFTLVEIMIALAIISLLALVAIPNFVRIRAVAKEKICAHNMRQIEDALNRCAADNTIYTFSDLSMSDIVPDYLRDTPSCPSNGSYSWNASGTASCDIHTATVPLVAMPIQEQ